MQSNSGVRANFYVIPDEFHLENNTVFEGYSIQKTYGVWGANPIGNRTFLDKIPIDGQLDFQVQALVGHNSTIWFNISGLWDGVGSYVPAIAYDTEGNWSNTQKITLGETAISVSPNPTFSPTNTLSPTPTVPEVPYIVIAVTLVFGVATVVALVFKKASHVYGTGITRITNPSQSYKGVVFYRLATFWFGWEQWLRIKNLQPFTG
jgi:hypothetical protein